MKQRGIPDPSMKEDVRHGDYIFPLRKYHTVLDRLHPVVKAHWHEESEFTLITRGGCRYHMNLDDVMVEEGDLLFLSPLLLHSAALTDLSEIQPEESFMESDTFVFHLNFLGGNTADICSMRYLTPLQNQELTVPTLIRRSHPAYGEAREIFDRLNEAYAKEEAAYELEIKALLLRLICLMIRIKPASLKMEAGGSSAHDEKIRNVLAYIEEHFAEPISVGELSSLCFFSQYHFMRFFKRHVGMTCVEYIKNLRLEKALELFEQGHTSVLEVALSVGFSNLSYFHRAFLGKYHVTPKTFLNLQRENRTFS